MQTINKKFKLSDLISFFTVLILVAFFANSCTEVIEPAKTKKRTLTIQARVKDCNTGVPSTPAPNAKIRIFAQNSETDLVLLDSVYTDKNGNATYINEGPVTGFTCKLIGEYNNQYVTTSPRAVFLFCNDTTVALNFECVPPPVLCCDELTDNSYNLVFTNGSDFKLVQNHPLKVAKYDAGLTILCNDLTCNPPVNFTVTVPNPKAPFTLSGIYVNGNLSQNPVTLKGGECISLSFSVSTANVGVFTDQLLVQVTCNGRNTNWAVNLNAEVIPEECACPLTADSVIVYRAFDPFKVPVGSSQDYDILLFQNLQNCLLTVEKFDRIKNGQTQAGTSNGEWRLVSPGLPTEVPTGEIYQPKMRFSPSSASERVDTFKISVRRNDGVVCNYTLVCIGYGCVDGCPLINGKTFAANNPINITVDAPFSPDDVCPQLINIVNYASIPLDVALPPSACTSPLRINVKVTGRDKYDVPRFTFSDFFYADTIFSTSPRLTFFSPSVNEFEAMFVRNGGTRTGASGDSSFHITVELTTEDGKCKQIINVTANITPAGKISIPWLMDAYNQTTSMKPTPDYQACKVDTLLMFAGVDRPGFVYQLRDASYQPYCQPPTNPEACWGTFFINVDNPTGEGTGANPKAPELYLVNNTSNAFKNIKLYATNYPEENFDLVNPIVIQLQSDVMNNGTAAVFPSNAATKPYNHPNGLGNIQPGNVYMLYSERSDNPATDVPCQIALVYIRQVINTDGLSTNYRSSITFRIIYPIYIHN